MSKPMDILIVDDESDIRSVIHERFTEAGDRPVMAGGAREALALAKERYFDVAVLDVQLPQMDGIELWKQLKALQPTMEVLFITGHASVDTALEAMKLGAYDYLCKPVELAELEILVRKAYEKKQLRKQTILLKEEIARRGAKANIVGTSQALDRVLRAVHQVAGTDSPVLISGETGTGKELVAQEVHATSLRRDNPLVAINCGALQETLVENELFGHEKGAFTGAQGFKRGLFESADEGTLFIDEIGELAMNAQVKLLRVLEDGSFRRLGDTRETQVDVRLICATNRRLEEEMRLGKFREDLYYRLNVFHIEVPPLRVRKEDIPILAYHFLQNGRAARRGGPSEILPDAMQLLVAHDWPGNVRELANAIERATILAMGRQAIEPADLPSWGRREESGRSPRPILHRQEPEAAHVPPAPLPPREPSSAQVAPARDGADLGEAVSSQPPAGFIESRPRQGVSLAEIEKEHILETLKECGGNRSKAARSLGISVRHMRRKLHEYGWTDSAAG